MAKRIHSNKRKNRSMRRKAMRRKTMRKNTMRRKTMRRKNTLRRQKRKGGGHREAYSKHATDCKLIKDKDICDRDSSCYYSTGRTGATTGCKKQYQFNEWKGDTPKRKIPKMVGSVSKVPPSRSNSSEAEELKALREEIDKLSKELDL